MENKTVNISELYKLPGGATLEGFVRTVNSEMDKYIHGLPCMIVCPGGGYHFCSEREAEPIAIDYYNRGYNTFVLRYDVAPHRFPLSLTELACSVDYIRRNAEEFRIDPNKIYVSGFSAGGHLVGSLANLWSELPDDLIDPASIDCKPNGIMLGYPVIFPESHRGSFQNLLGKEEYLSHPMLGKLTLHESVNGNNPPCFIWTTAEDAAVNPAATTSYTAALMAKGIKCECHIYPTGPHGGATCDSRTCDPDKTVKFGEAYHWLELSDKFFKAL